MKATIVATLAALATLAVGCCPAFAAGDPFLAQLVGAWIGRGAMVLNSNGAAEPVYCKVTNTLSADGQSLTQKGRCSLTSNSGPIDGVITAGDKETYTGTLTSLASRGPATLKGALVEMTRAADGRLEPATKTTKAADRIKVLQLDAQYVDKLTGQAVESVNTIELLPGGGYSLAATRKNQNDGSTYTSSKIVFSAK